MLKIGKLEASSGSGLRYIRVRELFASPPQPHFRIGGPFWTWRNSVEKRMRVPGYLLERRIPFETITHPPAFTAQKRAKILHLPGRQVAKSVLLAGPRGYVLAVLPAMQQVDLWALARLMGGPVRLAEPGELPRVFPDCEWGVVTPFGTLYGVPTVLEESLDPEAPIVVEGHTHTQAFRMRCRDFEQLEHARRASFAHRNGSTNRAG